MLYLLILQKLSKSQFDGEAWKQKKPISCLSHATPLPQPTRGPDQNLRSWKCSKNERSTSWWGTLQRFVAICQAAVLHRVEVHPNRLCGVRAPCNPLTRPINLQSSNRKRRSGSLSVSLSCTAFAVHGLPWISSLRVAYHF